MSTTNAQRNRRALILLGLGVAMYLVATELVFPWYDELQAAPEQVAAKTEQLSRYRRELLHRGSYETLTVDARKKIADARQYFLNDPAELQKIVEDSAKTVGIDLVQRSATQTKKIDAMVNEITISANFESTPGQVVRFFEGLRGSPKVLNVRTVQIDPSQIAFEPPKTGELRKTVRVNLTIAGQSVMDAADDRVK
jgi:hypothetical protein